MESSKQWYSEKLGLVPEWEDAILKLAVMNTGGPTSLTLWENRGVCDQQQEGISVSDLPDTRRGKRHGKH